MYNEELKSSKLAQFLNDYDYVFVDTCSLMEDSFPLFMDYLSKSKEYWKEDLQVIVLGECVEELKKHAKEKEKDRKIAALRALKIIRHDKWHKKAFTITKAEGSSFADNAIFTKVSGLRIHNKILVITQDKTLTTDLLKLNRLDSQKGRYLSVYRLTPHSELEKNPGENGEKTFNKKHEASSFQKVEKDNKTVALNKAQKVIIEEDNKLAKNLSNPNYKTKNKIKDIDNQLSKLNKLDANSLSALNLRFSKEDLLKKKEELLPSKKREKKENKKETSSVIVTTGASPSEALKRLALNYHSIVRDPSVSYVGAVHGNLDLTSDDLKKVDQLAVSKGNFCYNKGNVVYSFEKGKEYSVSCKSLSSKKPEEQKRSTPVSMKEEKKKNLPPKKEENKKTKTTPSSVKKENKPLPQKEKPILSKDDPILKKKIRIVKVKGSTSGGSSSAIPEGIVLVVGEPKTRTPKKEKAPVLKKAASKNDSSLLKEAMDADRVLNANLNNPNYPKEKALLEIQKQKTRLKKLSSKDISNLQLRLEDIERIEKSKQ
ncbi:MAG: hypothetical protein PUI68_01985 [Mollicutes bacterium]|nr:hypothetical protein [Mollicutes bacterium]